MYTIRVDYCEDVGEVREQQESTSPHRDGMQTRFHACSLREIDLDLMYLLMLKSMIIRRSLSILVYHSRKLTSPKW